MHMCMCSSSIGQSTHRNRHRRVVVTTRDLPPRIDVGHEHRPDGYRREARGVGRCGGASDSEAQEEGADEFHDVIRNWRLGDTDTNLLAAIGTAQGWVALLRESLRWAWRVEIWGDHVPAVDFARMRDTEEPSRESPTD